MLRHRAFLFGERNDFYYETTTSPRWGVFPGFGRMYHLPAGDDLFLGNHDDRQRRNGPRADNSLFDFDSLIRRPVGGIYLFYYFALCRIYLETDLVADGNYNRPYADYLHHYPPRSLRKDCKKKDIRNSLMSFFYLKSVIF